MYSQQFYWLLLLWDIVYIDVNYTHCGKEFLQIVFAKYFGVKLGIWTEVENVSSDAEFVSDQFHNGEKKTFLT